MEDLKVAHKHLCREAAQGGGQAIGGGSAQEGYHMKRSVTRELMQEEATIGREVT